MYKNPLVLFSLLLPAFSALVHITCFYGCVNNSINIYQTNLRRFRLMSEIIVFAPKQIKAAAKHFFERVACVRVG